MSKVRIIIRDQTSGIIEHNFIETIRSELAKQLWGFEYEELFPNSEEKIVLDHGKLNKNVCDIFILFVDDKFSNQIAEPENPDVRFSWTFFASDECPAIILYNYWNWMNAHEPLNISRELYRRYLIWHEMGHAHGLSHIPLTALKDGIQLPVMFQMTNQPKDVIDRFKVVGIPTKSEVEELNKLKL